MKCNVILKAHQHTIIDIDKKLPFTKTFFPKSKIEKRSYAEESCVIIKDAIDDVKLKSIKDQVCDVKLNFDCYTYSLFGLSLLDINFEVSKDVANKIIDILDPANFVMKSIMVMDNKEQSISNLFTTVLFQYFQSEKMMEIASEDRFLENSRKDQQELREVLNDELYAKYFFRTDSPAGGLSGSLGPILINDDKDEVTIDSNWKDIGAIEHTLYQNKTNRDVFLLKKTNYFKELHETLVVMCRQDILIDASCYMCDSWMENINSALDEIRSNISSDNENKFYWRELKKNIEVMDLNFLEFHTTISSNNRLMGKFPDTMDFSFSIDYIKEYMERQGKQRDNIFQILNEVKYAINNLATPGHTHDEHLLQEETEKVHERLLMISFIAMAIPSGVAIMTPEISIIIKIIAATAIFSIPLIYFSFRKVQKLLSYKRNMKSEFKRLIKQESINIIRNKEHNERLKTMDELPEDIKKGIVDLNLKGIASQEKRLNILKTKL